MSRHAFFFFSVLPTILSTQKHIPPLFRDNFCKNDAKEMEPGVFRSGEHGEHNNGLVMSSNIFFFEIHHFTKYTSENSNC